MKKIYFAASSLTGLVLLGAGAPGYAATAADTAATAPTGLTEVVVTARRREESAERVPTSILAIGKEALVERGVHTDTDLQLVVPGLIVRTFDTATSLTFAIRGESLDAYSGSAPGVQPYIDEIPITATTPSIIFDMSNVQVLKGPQGTLFGRNSTGGAVLYTTTKPGNEYGGYASVQYGNLDKLITEAAIDLPIVADRVLLRLAANFQNGGGYVKNLYNDQNLGDTNGGAYRATLLLKPTDKLTNTTTVQYSNIYGTPTPNQVFYSVPCAPGNLFDRNSCNITPSNPTFEAFLKPGQTLFTAEPFPGNGYVYPGGFYNYYGFIHSQGNYVVDLSSELTFHSLATFVGNTTSYEISPTLTVKNSFGYQSTILHINNNNSLSPYYLANVGGHAPGGPDYERPHDTVISDEIQIQGKALDNHLTYIAGFFFNDETDDFDSTIAGVAFIGIGPPKLDVTYAPYLFRFHQSYEDRSFAGFTQATYDFNDKLSLTGGVRYTSDQLSSRQVPGSSYYNLGGAGEVLQQVTQTNPSWTVSLDYLVRPEWMLYVSQRGSWRTGGYAPAEEPGGNTFSSAEGGNYFLPETIKDVEVGSKYSGRLGDIPFRFNVDFFNAWVNNVQKSVDTLINNVISSATINVAKANIMGVESDFELRPTNWLRVGGNGAWVDAEFISRTTELLGSSAILGHFADTPKYSGTLYADLTHTLSGDYGTLNYHVDVYYQSGMYFSSVSDIYTPHSEIPSYALVNMRVDWRQPLGARGLTASVFVKNLGNKLYYTGGNAGAPDDGAEAVNYGLPRTFGGILRYEF